MATTGQHAEPHVGEPKVMMGARGRAELSNQEKLVFGMGSGLVLGTVFGIALEKSKIYLPAIIREQALLNQFLHMKVLLAASTVALFGVAMMHMLEINRKFSPKHVQGWPGWGIWTHILGGLILGIGVTLSGSSPGSLLVQLGAGVDRCWWTLAGALFGTLMYGYAQKALRLQPPIVHTAPAGVGISGRRVEPAAAAQDVQAIDNKIYRYLATPSLVTACGLAAALLYWSSCWKDWRIEVIDTIPFADVRTLNTSNILFSPMKFMERFDLSREAWPPVESGILLGLLQLPSVYLFSSILGGAAAYTLVAGYLAKLFDADVHLNAPLFAMLMDNIQDYFHLGSMVGIIVGGFLSVYWSQTPIALANTAPIIFLFLGGFFQMIGSKLAGDHHFSLETGLTHLTLASGASLIASLIGASATAIILS